MTDGLLSGEIVIMPCFRLRDRSNAGLHLLLTGWLLLSCSLLRAQSASSVLSYGANADGVMRTDGAMTAGSTVLTSLAGSFTSSDAGKYIQVIGAGPGAISNADGSMAFGSATLSSAVRHLHIVRHREGHYCDGCGCEQRRSCHHHSRLRFADIGYVECARRVGRNKCALLLWRDDIGGDNSIGPKQHDCYVECPCGRVYFKCYVCIRHG